jgi:hypothetical protein
MKSTSRVVRSNLLIFVLYTLIIHATSGRDAAGISSAFAYVHAVGAVLIGVLMTIFNREGKGYQGNDLVLAGLLIAVIGYSVCLGTFELRLH